MDKISEETSEEKVILEEETEEMSGKTDLIGTEVGVKG